MGNSISSNQVFERLRQIENEGNVERAYELLRQVMNHGTKFKDRNGETALHHSCNENLFALSQLLIELGANVDAKDKLGYTPLHSACGARLELVKLFVDHGAHVNAVGDQGLTPLQIAIDDSEISIYLISKGTAVDAKDHDEATPFHHLCDWDCTIRPGHALMLAKFLVENDANVHAKDKSGNTPWILSCLRDNLVEVAKWLVEENGSNVNDKNNEGQTPLHYSSCGGNLEVVKLLV